MTLTPEMVRAYQRERVERLLGQRLGLGPTVSIPAEDDAGLPTAYGERDRNYYNDLLDDTATRDSLGTLT